MMRLRRRQPSSKRWRTTSLVVVVACYVTYLALHGKYLMKQPGANNIPVVQDFPQHPLEKRKSVQEASTSKGIIQAENGEPKTVLVLGALNFVGRLLVETLLERGDRVVVMVTDYHTEPQLEHARYLEYKEHANLHYFQESHHASYDSLKKTFEQHQPQWVCHLEVLDQAAGAVDGGDELSSFVGNFTNVLEVGRSFGVRNVVFVSRSSDGAEGQSSHKDSQAERFELLGNEYHQKHGINMAAVRVPLIYGPLGLVERIPMRLMDRVTRELPLTEPRAGEFFDLIFVSDAVRGIMAALDRHQGYDTYNIASGRALGWTELATSVESATGEKATWTGQPPSTADLTPVDTSKAKKNLGFEAQVTLQDGLAQTMEWYKKTYPSSPSIEQSIEPSTGETNGMGKRVCFFAAVFGDSAEAMDRIPSAFDGPKSIAGDPDKFMFLLFTNHEDFRKPGWHTVVLKLEDLPNHIIRSRFPKFMSWKLKYVVDNCRVMFYADGGWLPCREGSVFEGFASQAAQNYGGLIQLTHTRTSGPLDELSRIAQFRKDTRQKTRKERQWLTAQPDFVPDLPMYCNMAFGYDPHNKKYQELSTYFWNRYSSNEGTWRDQPFWCYTLLHYNVTPARLGDWPQAIRSPKAQLWRMAGAVGFNGHKYA